MTTKTRRESRWDLAATGGAIAYYVRLDVRRETRRNAGNLEIGFNSTMLASKASA